MDDDNRAVLAAIERLQHVGWFAAVARTKHDVIPQLTEVGSARFQQLGEIFDELDYDKSSVPMEEIEVILRFVNNTPP